MPFQYDNGFAYDATLPNQLAQQGAGVGWLSGGQVTVGDSGSSVELNCDGGYLRDGVDTVEVPPGAVVLPENTSGDPRQDVVYATTDGTWDYRTGIPNPAATDDAGNPLIREFTAVPERPSTNGQDVAVSATVWVPDGTTQSSHLTSSDIWDRRLETADPPRQPWQGWDVVTPWVQFDQNDYYSMPLPVRGNTYYHLWAFALARYKVGEGVVGWGITDMRFVIADSDGNSVRSLSGPGTFRSDNPIGSEEMVGGTASDVDWYEYRIQSFGYSLGPDEYVALAVSHSIDERSYYG